MVEIEEDLDGRVISRRLIQIFFIHLNQIELGQRFVANFIMIIDGTFHTNALRLLLLVAVGISNSNSTFPLAFSYCPSESEDAFGFFFDSLREMVFLKGTQGAPAGMPKAGGYTSTQVDGTAEVVGLSELC